MFDELANSLQKYNDNLTELAVDQMIADSAEMIDANISQLEEGQTTENKLIKEKYKSKAYAKFKKSIGSKAPLGTPNLKLTGNFYSGFKLKKEKDGVLFYSSDSKYSKLRSSYESIFGLNKQNRAIEAKNVSKKLQDEFKRAVQI